MEYKSFETYRKFKLILESASNAIDKIDKLSEMTVKRGASENEESVAFQKAKELVAKYDLTADDLSDNGIDDNFIKKLFADYRSREEKKKTSHRSMTIKGEKVFIDDPYGMFDALMKTTIIGQKGYTNRITKIYLKRFVDLDFETFDNYADKIGNYFYSDDISKEENLVGGFSIIAVNNITSYTTIDFEHRYSDVAFIDAGYKWIVRLSDKSHMYND